MKSARERSEKPHGAVDGRRKFHLGNVEVRPRSGIVSGPGGERKLDPKVMDVLVQLASAGGRVVTREALMDGVWKGVIVTDFALSRCIYQLRKNLAEVAENDQSPIETLPKRGYRLAWPVEHGSPPGRRRAGPPYKSLAYVAGLVLMVAVALLAWNLKPPAPDPSPGSAAGASGETRLVILPLVDLTEDGSQGAFSDGLSGEVAHQLSGHAGIAVVGGLSSRQTDFESVSELEYAGRLDADYLLGGSVNLIGETRRVVQYLQRASDGKRLWSRTFLVEPGAPFTAVGNIAWAIGERLRFTIDPASLRGSTENLEAFELYLAAFDADSLEGQRELLRQAVEIDPGFARAWDLRATIEVMPVWNGEATVEDAWRRAEPFVTRALEIDPGLSDAYVTLARFKREFGQLEEAANLLYEALERDPANLWASGNLGLILRFMGRYEEALAVHEADAARDPLAPVVQGRLGTSHWFMENYDEAERHYRLAAELDPGYEETYDSWAAMLALGRGRLDLGLAMAEKKIAIEDPPTRRSLLGAAAWAEALGLPEKALLYRHEAGQVERPETDPFHWLRLADHDRAVSAAELVLEEDPRDVDALLALASVETVSGQAVGFADRALAAFPDLADREVIPNPIELQRALLVALAYRMSDQPETASTLLLRILGSMPQPRSPQHLAAAAAYAMQGRSDLAMAELRASPPGRIRIKVDVLPHDPRFETLWDASEFNRLIEQHRSEIEAQKAAYLAGGIRHAGIDLGATPGH